METPIKELFKKYGHFLPDIENEYLQKEKQFLELKESEGYGKGYNDASREAQQEIREHYKPNR